MNKNKALSFIPSRGLLLLVIFFLFVLVLTFLFGERGILEIVKIKKEIKRLDRSMHGLEAEKSALESEVSQLRRNPQAVEKKAREKLWLMKKNEKVIVIEKENKEGKLE